LFFEKIIKIDKLVARLRKRERRLKLKKPDMKEETL
jgi:hypothetical protein